MSRYQFFVISVVLCTAACGDDRPLTSPTEPRLAAKGPSSRPSKLAFTVAPGVTQVGKVIAPAVEVTALDDAGKVATGYTQSVSISIGANPGGGSLSGTASVKAVGGVARFADLSIDRVGNGYTLVAAGPKVSSVTSAPFDVTQVPVASVAVAPSEVTVGVGGTAQLVAEPKDADGNPLEGRPVTWSSGDPAIATVDATGLVQGVALGSVVITATSEGQAGTASVTVSGDAVASVSVEPPTATVEVGATVQLAAIPRAADGSVLTGRAATWTSSNQTVARVSGDGVVTGFVEGSATITATVEGQSGIATITVVPGSGSVITDPYAVFTISEVPKPAYLSPIRPGPFDLVVVRVAGDPGTTIQTAGGSGTWGNDARHHYSKDQPWNADGTLLVLQNRDGGTPSRVFLDGQTYTPKLLPCSSYPSGEDRWHPSVAHANVRVKVRNQELMWFDIVRCVKTRSWALPFVARGIGPSEGNLSFDGRFIALTDEARMFLLDMEDGRIGPIRDLGDCGIGNCKLDWVSVSPSGRFVVVTYSGAFLRVYDVDPATLALTPRPMPASSVRCTGTAEQGYIYDLGHADMTFNPFDGDKDVIIGQEHCGNRGKVVDGKLMGGVVMVRLEDGMVTPLTDPANEAYPHHISTRNYERLGWAYVGYYPSSGKRFADEIVAVKLDGSGAVERYAHKHSATSGCYRCEAHAVPSPDGRRVLWASNWSLFGDGTTTVIQAYVVDGGNR